MCVFVFLQCDSNNDPCEFTDIKMFNVLADSAISVVGTCALVIYASTSISVAANASLGVSISSYRHPTLHIRTSFFVIE